MPDILAEIVTRKRIEVAVARDRVPTAALEGRLSVAPVVRDFFAVLAAPGPIRLIAEFKRKSPSAGEIRPGATIEEVVGGYATAGASCLSVLTDGPGFGGSLVDLESARIAVPLPVLRKEFVVDRYQVIEARAHGADAVLLIAECLDDCLLRSLYREILKTMTTDLDTVLRLRERVPDEVVLVAESGIKTRADVERLEAAGIAAMLVGESLLTQPDPGRAAAALLGC